MPARSARALRVKGARHGWEHRIRAGRVEYRETSLPAETREALADIRASRPLELPECPQPDPRSAALADARLEVLTVLDRWLAAENPRRLMDALHTFAALYTAGHVEVSGVTQALIPRISRASLHRWRRALREGGWRGLMSRQGARPPDKALDADCTITGAVGAFILEYPHGTATMLRRWLIARYGLGRSTHVATVRRWMARWRAENSNLLMEATDPDRYRSHRKPALGAAAAGVERINQLWELDSTPADVLCIDGRYHLVGVIDVHSRRARALVVPTSNAMGIAALMRRALLDWGVPETVRTDEGKDYVSRHVRRALADLAIEHDILPPYSPELKPFIERWFGTLTRGCLAYLPGFAGHNVAERQAIRDRKSFAARRGEGDADAFRVSLTAAELQARIDAWIEHVYEREPHGGLDGRSPFEAAAGQPVRRIENERALDLLLAPPPSGRPDRVVGKQGLRVDGGTYLAGELGPWVGFTVQVRTDPTDLGVVYVFAGEEVPVHLELAPGAFVCRAEDPSRVGMDRAEVAAKARAHAREADRKGRAHARELKRRFRPELAMTDTLEEAARRTGQVVPFRAPAPAHESPDLGEAAAAVRDAATPPEEESFFLKHAESIYADLAAKQREAEARQVWR